MVPPAAAALLELEPPGAAEVLFDFEPPLLLHAARSPGAAARPVIPAIPLRSVRRLGSSMPPDGGTEFFSTMMSLPQEVQTSSHAIHHEYPQPSRVPDGCQPSKGLFQRVRPALIDRSDP